MKESYAHVIFQKEHKPYKSKHYDQLYLGSTSVLIVGGTTSDISLIPDLEILGGHANCELPEVKGAIILNACLFKHKNDILLCGGYGSYEKECLKLETNGWIYYNDMIYAREIANAICVEMKHSTYVLGSGTGSDSGYKTSEILKHNSNTWEIGPSIPGGFGFGGAGCSVRISKKELLIIGGGLHENRILKLDTDANTWYNTSIQLLEGCSGGIHPSVVLK